MSRQVSWRLQLCLLSLIEKWEKSVDNGSAFNALHNDLSKAFDCLPHEFLIAKLDAYGFDKSSLRLVHTSLSNRKQRVKINDRYSSWSEILFGVLQGSNLGPLLFNIFVCDSFTFLSTLILQIMRTILRHIVRVKGPNLLSIP